MNHLGTVTLESSRLILRRFVPGDAPAMFTNWASDPEVTKFLTWPPHKDVAVTHAYIEDVRLPGYGSLSCYEWVIELKNSNQIIGSIGAVSCNEAVGSVHIGYCLGRTWWRQGIMSEALRTVMEFFFTRVGVNKVESRHDPKNPNSGRVMVACGMKYEGTIRWSDINNQGICDAAWYGILRSEYQE